MNKDQFDQWFDATFEEAVRESEQPPTPEADASWERIRKRLILQRRKKIRRRRWQMGITIAVSLCIGGFIFGSPQLTKAIEPIKAIIIQLSDEVVGIFYGEREENPDDFISPPPPDDEAPDFEKRPDSVDPNPSSSSAQETVLTRIGTIEEAVQGADFPVYSTEYVKEGYDLVQVELSEDREGRVVLVNYTYEREDLEDVYLINQSALQPGSVMNFNNGDNDSISDIMIGQTQGKLFEGKRNMMLLFHEKTLIMIRGDLTPEELEEIALSMIQK